MQDAVCKATRSWSNEINLVKKNYNIYLLNCTGVAENVILKWSKVSVSIAESHDHKGPEKTHIFPIHDHCQPSPPEDASNTQAHKTLVLFSTGQKMWKPPHLMRAAFFFCSASSPLWRLSPYLQRHLDEHEELLDADPDPLPFELVCDVSPLFICEAPQQLRRENKGRWRFSLLLPRPSDQNAE